MEQHETRNKLTIEGNLKKEKKFRMRVAKLS